MTQSTSTKPTKDAEQTAAPEGPTRPKVPDEDDRKEGAPDNDRRLPADVKGNKKGGYGAG